jgi:hypothetical protein
LEQEVSKIDEKLAENKALLLNPEYQDFISDIQKDITELENSKQNLLNSMQEIKNSANKPASEDGIDINPNVAIMEVRAGTGGSEAALFAFDLYRMYMRYCEKKGFKTSEEFLSNEDSAGGIKTVVFEIKGKDVYDLFKNESGVHRVQRVPKTEVSGRIHTSTATVAIMPEVKNIEFEIHPDDLIWEFHRSGGCGDAVDGCGRELRGGVGGIASGLDGAADIALDEDEGVGAAQQGIEIRPGAVSIDGPAHQGVLGHLAHTVAGLQTGPQVSHLLDGEALEIKDERHFGFTEELFQLFDDLLLALQGAAHGLERIEGNKPGTRPGNPRTGG